MALPSFTATIDIICLLTFSTVKLIRHKRRKSTQYQKYRDALFVLLVVVALLDTIISLLSFERMTIANLLRPAIVLLCYQAQQDFIYLVALNIKDSSAMLFCLLIWILYFAVFGQFLFESQSEGIMLFNNFSNSYWEMFVCLTTENYPDVMLLATAENAAYSLFFILFILFGVFFLTSVLLPVIFDNFKNQMEILQKKKVSHRMEYIEQFFDAFDEQGNGWLTLKQTKLFFSAVLDLDYKRSSHRKTF